MMARYAKFAEKLRCRITRFPSFSIGGLHKKNRILRTKWNDIWTLLPHLLSPADRTGVPCRLRATLLKFCNTLSSAHLECCLPLTDLDSRTRSHCCGQSLRLTSINPIPTQHWSHSAWQAKSTSHGLASMRQPLVSTYWNSVFSGFRYPWQPYQFCRRYSSTARRLNTGDYVCNPMGSPVQLLLLHTRFS